MSKVNKNATEHEFVTPDEEPAAKNNETKAGEIHPSWRIPYEQGD